MLPVGKEWGKARLRHKYRPLPSFGGKYVIVQDL